MAKKDKKLPLTLAPLEGAMRNPTVVSKEEAELKRQRQEDMAKWKKIQNKCPEYHKWIS